MEIYAPVKFVHQYPGGQFRDGEETQVAWRKQLTFDKQTDKFSHTKIANSGTGCDKLIQNVFIT